MIMCCMQSLRKSLYPFKEIDKNSKAYKDFARYIYYKVTIAWSIKIMISFIEVLLET